MQGRRGTRTSSFGTNGRVSHDSSAYYARALQPVPRELLDAIEGPESTVPSGVIDRVFCHSSESMAELPDRSVHLMVTSPPYNVGKEYDNNLTLGDYRSLLGRVLKETHRVLVPGGRACVNVANLGRKPYIPLHSYVIEDAAAAGFYMRGEIIWNKGVGAGPSTAWGSWQSPSNPTLRDVHEYILVFQKPPFRRISHPDMRATITREEFLDFTKSIWTFKTESAKRAGHPAPFPVTLPYRLIQLYTYEGEVVIDPFIGSGATAIASLRSRRHWVGYEVQAKYVELCETWVARETAATEPDASSPK